MKSHLHGSVGVSPAFRTKRAGRPRSFGLHFMPSEMRPEETVLVIRYYQINFFDVESRNAMVH